nr:MAG TPA: hypothetical protein [Caudoviricetes sp.]
MKECAENKSFIRALRWLEKEQRYRLKNGLYNKGNDV